jgi:predicted phage terminase large subunit-like protein
MSYPDVTVKTNQTDWFVTFPNGSEIWFGGLDDKERTEKILGNEYVGIFLNECSEISWDSRNIAKTRLAQRTELKNKMYYDENPPKPSHWSCRYFIDKVDPVTEQPLPNPEQVASMLMNPRDNLENIDPNYIPNVLEQLPFILRKRFLEGEFWSDDSDIFQPLWIKPGLTGNYVCKISACDPAISEKQTADEAAIVTIGITPEGRLEEIEAIHDRWGFDNLIKNLHAVEARHKPDYAGVEPVAFQKSVAAVVRRDNPNTRWVGLDTFGIRSDVDKVRRAISVSYLLERGMVSVNTPALSKQMLEFEGGDEKNDIVDAFVMALQIYQKCWHPASKEKEFVPLTYEQRVHKFMDDRRKRQAKMKQSGGRDPVLGTRW